MDAGNNEVLFSESSGELIDSFLLVDEDHALGDGQVLVQLNQSVEFVLFFVHGDVELLDTIKCELLVLDKNSDWGSQELVGHLENLRGHGG